MSKKRLSQTNKDNRGIPWWRREVVYQIYPRSFKDGNGDGTGDIPGIIDKLDYLNDGTENSLGIGAIWLSPIYVSPMKDFGYDIADYRAIDPLFGTMEDFERLIEEAHKRDIRVLMDFIPNHTSEEHAWFQESRQSRENPKRDWYIWKDPKPDNSPPNNWLSIFGGPSWTLDPATGQYYLHTFLKEQPDLNWRNPEVVDAMLDVVRFWFEKGADGIRVDSIESLIKDEQFRDEPENLEYVPGRDWSYDALVHTRTRNLPELSDVLERFGGMLNEYKDRFAVFEAYHAGTVGLRQFYENTKAHGQIAPLNFCVMRLPWNAQAYKTFLTSFEDMLDEYDWPVYFLGNHDTSRFASRMGQDNARAAALLLLTIRGMPIIYYGDEIGMEDVPIPPEKVQDPAEFGTGVSRDPERTPMQWNDSEYAGFSTAEPWLPVAHNYRKVNVEKQKKDPTSMLSWYRQLLHFRQSAPALMWGSFRAVETGNHNVFGFVRESKEQRLLVLANFVGDTEKVSIDEHGKPKLVCNTRCDAEERDSVHLKDFKLRGYEGVILEL